MDHVRYLADPRLEGRGVGTAGIEYAATYLERAFEELGLAPGGENGGYRQDVEVVTGVEVVSPTDLTIGGRERVDVGDALMPLGFSASAEADARVVFVGYGITAPEHAYDDYAGIEVTNRFVLVLRGEPGALDKNSRFDGDLDTPHTDLRTKAINAREHGAIGLLVVNGPRDHEDDELTRPRADAGYMSSGLVAAQVSRPIADRLLRSSERTIAQLQEFIDVHQTPRSAALADSVRLRVALVKKRAHVHNVVGVLPGRDTTRAITIGAHYDHLGFGGENSLAPRETGKAHLGADDNASGTAALLALARAWTARREPPAKSIVFAAFAAEELGLLGSGHYVGSPAVPIERTDAMLNFDMVGRLRGDRLLVMGAGTAEGLDSLVSRTARPMHFALKLSTDGYGPSDHSSFYKARVPVLAFFTGAHADYHKPSDTWDKVDAGGIARVAALAYALSESLVTRPPLPYQIAAADSQFRQLRAGAGHGAYLGTIPDYTQTEGGVKLSDVRDQSPAQAAGILGGDVIVSFDDVRVDNIYDFTYALRARRPGQLVRIGILRGEERLTLTATLGKRSAR
jgi:hypothetical protein